LPRIGAVRQVALSSGRDLDATLAFWRDVFGLVPHARYDPPGIAFILAGPVRILFTDGIGQGTIYLDIDDIDGFCAAAAERGVAFTAMPAMVHHDREGLFGTPGEAEWMAFLKDPAGNTIGLVERKADARR